MTGPLTPGDLIVTPDHDADVVVISLIDEGGGVQIALGAGQALYLAMKLSAAAARLRGDDR